MTNTAAALRVVTPAASATSSASTGSRAIGVHQVTKSFKSASGVVRALDEISVDIRAGEFVSVVGPSGCGKSTLMSLIAGLKQPSGGEIRIGDTRVSGPYTDVGIVFQRDLLMEWRTTLENVLLQIDMRGLRRKDYTDRAMQLLSKVGLADFADKYPRELSGGMRQRASICRALIHDPPVLLMDEPFGALDALTRDDIAADLTQLCEQTGKTVVFITHSIAESVFLSDRVLVMSPRPGRILEDIRIDLPRPRRIETRDTVVFTDYMHRIRTLLTGAGGTRTTL
ncbi:MAG: ABC transporter ATP-binding protein [Burkholderiales bacterium]|nr:MAG: ABC transporter ATP-binding protein [Burkholderiales bacterium]